MKDRESREKNYPCADCGKPRTKAEGGTIFTVCDECWFKYYKKTRATSKIITSSKEKFEEEFEDEIEIENYEDNCREDVILNKKDLVDLIRKYFSLGECEFRQKVRIKARKGKIVIERIEE